MQPLFMALTMLICVVSTAAGAIYTYRDAQGRLHFTNQLERVPVTYRAAALANQRPETPVPAAPSASSPLAAVAPFSSPPAASPPPAATTPTSRPVDTHELGLIRLGMTPEEVRQRLGSPTSVIKRQGEERWLYPGNNQVRSTFILFKSGKVTFRGREGTTPISPASDFTFRKQN